MLTKITEDLYVDLEDISQLKFVKAEEAPHPFSRTEAFFLLRYRNIEREELLTLAEGEALKKAIDNEIDGYGVPGVAVVELSRKTEDCPF